MKESRRFLCFDVTLSPLPMQKHVSLCLCTHKHTVCSVLFYFLQYTFKGTPAELFEYIPANQLTQEFGGSVKYNHQDWVRFRMVRHSDFIE